MKTKIFTLKDFREWTKDLDENTEIRITMNNKSGKWIHPCASYSVDRWDISNGEINLEHIER